MSEISIRDSRKRWEKQEKYFLFLFISISIPQIFLFKEESRTLIIHVGINTFLCQDCFLNYRIIIEIEFDLPGRHSLNINFKEKNFFL